MHNKVIVWLTLAFMLNTSVAVAAGYVEIKCFGTVETSSSSPSKKLRLKAIENGKRQAIEKFIAQQPPQRVRILNRLREKLFANLDLYVPEASTLDDGRQDNGAWKIGMLVSINDAQIEALASESPETSAQKEMAAESLSFVFVAREVSAVESRRIRDFQHESKFSSDSKERQSAETAEKSSSRNGQTSSSSRSERSGREAFDAEAGLESSDDAQIYDESKKNIRSQARKESHDNEGSSRSNVSRKETSEVVRESGGSSTAETKKFRVYSSNLIETKVTEIFGNAGMDVVLPYQAQIDPAWFVGDFERGDDVSKKTEFLAVEAGRTSRLSLLAVATLDVGMPMTDSATGLQKVYVVVTAYAMDLRGKFSKRIASVGPIQYGATGETEDVAKVNALTSAGEATALKLVDQIRIKFAK